MKLVTILITEDSEEIFKAVTEVDCENDIERHLENWHALKTAFKRNEVLEEEQALDAKEKLDLTEPH